MIMRSNTRSMSGSHRYQASGFAFELEVADRIHEPYQYPSGEDYIAGSISLPSETYSLVE